MSLSTQPYKGTRDFYPEDKRVQKYIFSILSKTAEQFGYEETDASILESLDIYLSKTSQEIINEEVYSFEDCGGRQVAIRPEWTPTISRMVAARRQELAYPLRLYAIPNLLRYERPQRGRLREHWQLNVDIFGINNINADFEIIQVADQVLKNFGAKPNMYQIKINHRGFVNALLYEYIGVTEVQGAAIIRLIDRMHKIERAELLAQLDAILTPSQREEKTTAKLVDLLAITKVSQLPKELKEHAAVIELKTVLHNLKHAGISNAIFDITLMRGFDYYTGVVFEVFDIDPENNRSMFGGGRYDGLVGLFGVEPVPTVGFGMGDVTLRNFLDSHALLPDVVSETDAYVVLIGDIFMKAQPLLQDLRNMGLNLAVDSSGQKLDKQIKAATKKGLRYALFIGEKELEDRRLTLKDLQAGTEETHVPERIISIIRDQRKTDYL